MRGPAAPGKCVWLTASMISAVVSDISRLGLRKKEGISPPVGLGFDRPRISVTPSSATTEVPKNERSEKMYWCVGCHSGNTVKPRPRESTMSRFHSTEPPSMRAVRLVSDLHSVGIDDVGGAVGSSGGTGTEDPDVVSVGTVVMFTLRLGPS